VPEKNYTNEPMLELYIFETSQLLEQLEQCALDSEKTNNYSSETINEIFRIMHTIKGSSSMMLFDHIATLAHSVEDLFYLIREQQPRDLDISTLSDLVLEGVDFLKVEIQKIKNGDDPDGDSTTLINNISQLIQIFSDGKGELCPGMMTPDEDLEKPHYYIPQEKAKRYGPTKTFKVTIFFEDDCDLENLRAYSLIQNLREITEEFYYYPQDIMENDDSSQVIKERGFTIVLKSDRSIQQMDDFFQQTVYLKHFDLIEMQEDEYQPPRKDQLSLVEVKDQKEKKDINDKDKEKEIAVASSQQNIISVNVAKLDSLMDLVGEMVIAEAMVTQNPDLRGLHLENFHKAARQLKKITSEIQDVVMSIRMVPLSGTFQKMHRIVRDMSKKLNKDVRLELIGEETEVDKNIIEHISDPLMHLIRNAIDHGIEPGEERIQSGKPAIGTITLEAKNAGSDVLVSVKDDGKGLNKQKILERAIKHNLLTRNENELSEKDIFNLIFLPGFSTKDNITEFSGRGVGMDVVLQNLQTIGGSASVESVEGRGTTITLKIPLTLAIIDGMNVRVGSSRYTIPTMAIKQSFRPQESDVIRDPDGNEMIMVRGQCYPILRLHEIFQVKADIRHFGQGILIMVETDEQAMCLFADELLGEQQVVVKALPNYLKSIRITGLAGCTLLGDGNISLILDIAELWTKNMKQV
jgi:two-component system chemotaxis sensor kinase CheA